MRAQNYLPGVVALLAPFPAAAAPSLTSDMVIGRLQSAIEQSDRQAFASIDGTIEYLPEWKSTLISSDQAVDLLAGCEFQTRGTVRWGMTDLKYRCPSRENKLRCTTGNLTVMIYDERGKTEIGLSEDRILADGCPKLPVPPAVGVH